MDRTPTRGVFSSLLLVVALTPACGGDDSGPVGTGGTSTGGGSGGSHAGSGGSHAGSGGSPIDPGGPLLDRPSAGKYECSASRPVERFALPWAGFSLVPGTEESHLALLESSRSSPDPNRPGDRVTWSALDVNGTLGSPTVLRPATSRRLATVTATSNGEKSTIVWSETSADGNTESLNSLQVDAAGTVVTPTSALVSLSMSTRPRIARAGSGYALLWVDSKGSSGKLTFGLLDANGKLTGAPVVLAQSRAFSIIEGDIAYVGGTFVVSYSDFQYRDSGLVSRLLVLGSDGSVIGEPIVFADSAATGFASTVPSLLVRDDQVLAAWSVTRGDSSYEVQEAATTIRVARFDAHGTRQGPIFDLQAPVADVEHVQPVWVEVGEDVGLLWAEGSIIYLCGGCVPDHSLKFVVLDGQTFLPQSNVAKISNTLPSGGLLSPAAALHGNDLLVVSTVTYHTSGEGASASIRCVE